MRLIARLDVKNGYVIKGIHLEGLRKVGDPQSLALGYYEQGVDEIIFMDAVASLYDRNHLFGIIEQACEQIFVPITIGGGLRTLKNVGQALMAGADKVSINTAAVHNPNFITDVALKYGSQCVVASVEAKRSGDHWEAYIDNGREKTNIDVVEWVAKLEQAGAGEILLTGIDNEGTKKGFDVDLIKAVNEMVTIPVIASGGCGKTSDIANLLEVTPVSAVAIASLFHYKIATVSDLRNAQPEVIKGEKFE